MSWAIDRETLARDVMKGLAVPAKGTHAAGTPGYDPDITGYGYDPRKAKQLLADAGFPNGLPLEIWIPAGGAGSPFGIQMNEFIQQNFKDVGIDAKFDQYETFQNNMANGVQQGVNAIQVGFSVDEFVNAANVPDRPPAAQREHKSGLVQQRCGGYVVEKGAPDDKRRPTQTALLSSRAGGRRRAPGISS